MKLASSYTLAQQIKDTAEVHGVKWTALHYKKRIPFTLFYWMLFGKLPGTRLVKYVGLDFVETVQR